MISIIIPIFNAENYLKRMLESILGQSYQKFECILIDDGSSDSSYSICKEYEEKILACVALRRKIMEFLTQEIKE